MARRRSSCGSTPQGPNFTWKIQCADSERIPWIDVAWHDKFILHGAGYEGRYQGGLDQREHGAYSDDYITTEVLSGRPAMVPQAFNRDVVRVYWLLNDAMKALALDRIDAVEFAGDNIHRQHVKWERGGEVWVNRGAEAVDRGRAHAAAVWLLSARGRDGGGHRAARRRARWSGRGRPSGGMKEGG